VLQLPGNGVLALTPAGARVAALTFSEDEESLFFAHPALESCDAKTLDLDDLVGGIGGDRLRFAPEFAYAWKTPERDLVKFSNYAVQAAEDPAEYALTRTRTGARFEASPRLVDYRTGDSVEFAVRRDVNPLDAAPCALPSGVRFCGYRLEHSVEMSADTRAAERMPRPVGLWSLLQMPAGTTLLVPTRGPAKPMRYFNAGMWTQSRDVVRWTLNGQTQSKIGFDWTQLTGRAAALRRVSNERWALIVRQFALRPGAYYPDAPTLEQAGGQVVQLWDGFGFGELEYHTPAVGPAPLPGSLQDVSELWAFDGGRDAIRGLGRELLGVDPSVPALLKAP
jgi:hypothetical protein